MNRCHVCGGIAVHSDAALCLTCSTAADREEVAYDPDKGWHRTAVTSRPLDEWHEDDGFVVWWTWQDGQWLGEPSYIGSPLCSDWPGYHTHWTPHPVFPAPVLPGQRAAPEAALPNGSNIEVSAVREGSRRAL